MNYFETSVTDSAPPVVLYLSDDTGYLNTVRRNLGQAGFSVVTTRSPAELVELTQESTIDAILSDYDLPNTDALSLFKKMHDQLKENIPPTLILNEHESTALRAKCDAVGTAGMYVKTDSVETLVDRVTGLIRDKNKRNRIAHYSSRRRFQGGTDSLTRVASKDHFLRRFNGESIASKRDQSHLSLLAIIIDDYEQIVERFGTQKAEKALSQSARFIEGELRSRDCVARYSDHTFAIILPDTPIEAAVAVGRRLRRRLSAGEFGDLDLPISLTISVGATRRPPGMTTPPKELLLQALASAKAAVKMGGNRVLADSDLTGSPLVLVVGDPAGEIGAISHVLEDCNVEIRLATSLFEARETLQNIPVAMVISDYILAGTDTGVELLSWARNRFPAIRRVLLADSVSPTIMTTAINEAAVHFFIPVPSNLGKLPSAIDSLLFS